MLSDTLRFLVKQTGKTQTETASKLGLSQQRFNSYISGKRIPDTDTLLSLADHFHVSTDYLLGRPETKKASPSEDELAVLLQEPLLKEIYETLLKLSPEQQKMLLLQIRSLKGLESDAKNKAVRAD